MLDGSREIAWRQQRKQESAQRKKGKGQKQKYITLLLHLFIFLLLSLPLSLFTVCLHTHTDLLCPVDLSLFFKFPMSLSFLKIPFWLSYSVVSLPPNPFPFLKINPNDKYTHPTQISPSRRDSLSLLLRHHVRPRGPQGGEERADVDIDDLALHVDGPVRFGLARATGKGGEVDGGRAQELGGPHGLALDDGQV